MGLFNIDEGVYSCIALICAHVGYTAEVPGKDYNTFITILYILFIMLIFNCGSSSSASSYYFKKHFENEAFLESLDHNSASFRAPP